MMACNPHLQRLEMDVLYHFGLNTIDHDMEKMFGDIKFVCVGGSRKRMAELASFMQQQLEINVPPEKMPINLASNTDRYELFKVGPVLIADHGIGMPSLSVMLHELLKLLHYAGCEDVILMRIGTSGGLGFEPGTVVVSDKAVDGMLSPNMQTIILGKMIRRPAVLDAGIVDELLSYARDDDTFIVARGSTLCTDDFYEGQARLDGVFCEYGDREKMNYMKLLYKEGVRNIEMESLCFAAMCHHSGHKCAVVCVTLLDRFQRDQVTIAPIVLHEWERRPSTLVARFIRKRLGLDK